jgi:acyl carrier protein
MSQAIERDIYAIIDKHRDAGAAPIGPDSTLKDLGIESLDAIEIIFEIEEHLDVTLPERDPRFDIGSVQGLVDAFDSALASKMAGGAPAVG